MATYTAVRKNGRWRVQDENEDLVAEFSGVPAAWRSEEEATADADALNTGGTPYRATRPLAADNGPSRSAR